MASGKTHFFDGKLLVEIPQEAADALGIKAGEEIEFSVEGKKVVLLGKGAAPAAAKAEAPKAWAAAERKTLTDREIVILKRVNDIRSWNRTIATINKELTRYEKAIFDYLLKNKIIFAYKKEGKELFGISKEYLDYVIGKRLPKEEQKEEKKEAKEESPKDPLTDKLEKEGFLVLEHEGQAKELNMKLRYEKKEGTVKGTRGFDKKYYVIKTDRLMDLERRLPKAIGKGKSLKDIAAELKLSEGLCKAAIELMREDGKIIEKRRDVYALA
jgi:biotin operon repressor/antitoxin component of MazEF toxin-antitoxin module